MPKSEKFWDRLAKKYAKQPIKDMQSYNQTMDQTKAHLSKDDSVLEIGCGTGSTALLLAGSVEQITARDTSGKMVDIANAKAKDQQIGNTTFAKGSVFDDALGEQSFNVVMAFNLLHLLEDMPSAIRRVNALLKPGGLFISKTVCMKGQGGFLPMILPVMQFIGLAPYVRFLTSDELEGIVTNEGFEIIETGDYPASPPSRFIVARKT
ncbi:MAG: class I SAM-dependent methyltransferase [Alphaproteobacteria bacterium]|nr:class I SAM-dependent methyltransferase [Alphaproteobacteria bacterium]